MLSIKSEMRCRSNGEVFPLSGATDGRCEVNTCEMQRLREKRG